MSRWPCLAAAASGCLLRVAASPNAGRTAAAGLHDGCLRVRLAAPALDGRANDALLAWLAAELCLPQSALCLRRGGKSRRKQIAVAAPAQQVAAWLDGALSGGRGIE